MNTILIILAALPVWALLALAIRGAVVLFEALFGVIPDDPDDD